MQKMVALKPGVSRWEVFGWALYDFANSGYTTVVLTAVFSAYFVSAVVGDATLGTLWWTWALSLSHLIVMLTVPLIGARSDKFQRRRGLLAMTTVGCVLTTAGLSMVGPGAVGLAIVLLILSNVFFSWGESLISSYLPSLARPESMGKVSGWGWGLGYIGGMLTLGVCLWYVLKAQSLGQTAADFVPVTMLITAAIFALAAGLSIGLLRDRPGQSGEVSPAWQRLQKTWQHARQFQDFVWLLGCTVAYMAGVAVAIALAAIYAQQVIGFSESEIMILIFVLNIAAVVGALTLGYAQDWFGHRLALAFTLLGWVATCLIAASVTTKGGFWVAGVIAGLCMGASQSVGRAMVGLLAPASRLGEFYGLWTLATRLASILGPLVYGLLTWASLGNQRLAMAATALFFLMGLLLLLPINMLRGKTVAQQKN
ncbi:MFS transporter [Orrella daihaiensis]|uniref:MFS transporter n=1 Tax=Orrella daihaiensis TaxID=2782176 RepID=A0ABY4AI64_9BURK|nr:MFS transporter [Orrella daihaiensis]UOD49978.1 MFS transporter [Orrella daihaiensis]